MVFSDSYAGTTKTDTLWHAYQTHGRAIGKSAQARMRPIGPDWADLNAAPMRLSLTQTTPAWTFGDLAGDQEIELGGDTHRTRDLERGAGLRGPLARPRLASTSPAAAKPIADSTYKRGHIEEQVRPCRL
jgi:hypothetical protein